MFIQDDVNREMEAVKKSKPKTYGEIRSEVERESARCEEPDDILDKKWTQKKSYSTQQMMKIMDAVRSHSVLRCKFLPWTLKSMMTTVWEFWWSEFFKSLIDRNALILHQCHIFYSNE